MKTILHLFKKDTRQQAGWIVFWLILLCFRLFIDTRSYESNSILSAASMPIILMVLGFAMVYTTASAALADSLGNHGAFYRTRPIRHSEIIGAKIMFLLVWIIAPILLFDTIYLLSESASFFLIVSSIIERSLLLLLIGLAVTANATSFKDYTSWGRTMGIALIALWISVGLWSWLRSTLESEALRSATTTSVGIYLALFYLVIAFGIQAYRSTFHVQPFKRAVVTTLLIAIMLPGFFLRWQQRILPLRPSGTDQIDRNEIAIKDADIDVIVQVDGVDPSKASLRITATPMTSPELYNAVEWDTMNSETIDANGKNQSSPTLGADPRVFRRGASHSGARSWDLNRIANLLPTGTHVISPHSIYASNVTSSPATVRIPLASETLDFPTTLQGTVRGRRFGWNLVGELEMKQGVKLAVEGSEWELVRAHRNTMHNAQYVEFEWRYPSLRLTKDQRYRNDSSDPLTRHEYVVYLPENKVALVSASETRKMRRGISSTFKKSLITLRFEDSSSLSLPPIDMPTARLLIFEKSYTDEIEVPFTKKNVILADYLQSSGSADAGRTDKITRQDFESRIQALGNPPTDVSRIEAGRYLYPLIRAIEARQEWVSRDHALAVQLKPLASAHMEMFLDGLENSSHRAGQALESAVYQGLENRHKPLLFSRLKRNPNLAQLITARGWEEDARESLIELAKTKSNLPYYAVRAIVLLKEPSTYPYLIEDFRRQKKIEVYEALRVLPPIADDLDRTVRFLWERRSRVFADNTQNFDIHTVAMRHGIREALSELHSIIQRIDTSRLSQFYGLAAPIRANVDLNDLDRNKRNNTVEVLTWVKSKSPNAFHYDPVRRRYFFDPA